MFRRLVSAAVVLVLVGAFAAWTGFQLLRAADDLRQAQDLIDRAATALEDGEIGVARDSLDRAERLVSSANDSIHTSVGVDLLSLVPGVRQNISAVEDSIELGLSLIHGGRQILADAVPLESDGGTLEVSLADGSLPIGAIDASRVQISRLLAQLITSSTPGDSSLLLPPVRELRDRIVDEARRREDQLRVLDRGLGLLQEFSGADRPRRYLLAIANTAEMRGSGGMILNYGVLEGSDGVLSLTAFGRVDEIALEAPVSEELVPPDYLARWNGFDQLRRWRQANLSPDFTVVAPVLEAMYRNATGRPVDGVIQVDPHGLAAVLEGVGPVEVEEVGQVTAENVVALTMHDAYIQFPGVEDRSDVLGDVAEAAFRRLVEGDIPSIRNLATAIAEAVDARHIIAHSRSESTQAAFGLFGADGSLPSPGAAHEAYVLTAQNLSGNKLDYFLDTDLALTGSRDLGEPGELTATVTLTNTATPGVSEPRYIYGPGFTDVSPPSGVLRSLVTLYLPVGTSVSDSDGDGPLEPLATGTEAGRPYVSFTYDVPAGESRSLSLSLNMAPRPSGTYEIHLVPTPFIRPTTATIDITTDSGRIDETVTLDRTWIVTDDREPVAALAPIYQPRGSGRPR